MTIFVILEQGNVEKPHHASFDVIARSPAIRRDDAAISLSPIDTIDV
jgi:hypothetical protein